MCLYIYFCFWPSLVRSCWCGVPPYSPVLSFGLFFFVKLIFACLSFFLFCMPLWCCEGDVLSVGLLRVVLGIRHCFFFVCVFWCSCQRGLLCFFPMCVGGGDVGGCFFPFEVSKIPRPCKMWIIIWFLFFFIFWCVCVYCYLNACLPVCMCIVFALCSSNCFRSWVGVDLHFLKLSWLRWNFWALIFISTVLF